MTTAIRNIRGKLKDLTRRYMKEIRKILRMFRDKDVRKQIEVYISELDIQTHIELEILKSILLAVAAWKAKDIDTSYLLQVIYWNTEKRDYWGGVINTLKEIAEQKQTQNTQGLQEKVQKMRQEEEQKSKETRELFSFANAVWKALGYDGTLSERFAFALRDKLNGNGNNEDYRELLVLAAKIFNRANPAGGWGLFIHELHHYIRIAKIIRNDNFRLKNRLISYLWKKITGREEYTDWGNILRLAEMPYTYIASKMDMLRRQDASHLPSLNPFLKSIYDEWVTIDDRRKLEWRRGSMRAMMEDAARFKLADGNGNT